MQNPISGAWPVPFFPPHLIHGIPSSIAHPASNKPRVGLGVICRCLPHKYSVECLLLKRGHKFVSPLKWSFPGGRLEEEGGDFDDDGERSTIKELKKECGGGIPPGLPPLIHIESYKAGKTLYHVFVIDSDAQPTWLNWQPLITPEHTGEIDQTAKELVLQGKSYPSANGFCWMDMQTLIEECMAISNTGDPESVNTSELQHGLVRWVKANGESILKTLMARSPKLERHRRYPSSSGGDHAPGQTRGMTSRPRSGSAGSRMRKFPSDNNHMYTAAPMVPGGQQVFRPLDHYGNLQGVAPFMQMPVPPLPEYFKPSSDPISQAPPTSLDDSAHIYPTPGIVHVPVPTDLTTPTQSDQQHSPIKNQGLDDKLGNTGGFPTLEAGNGEDTNQVFNNVGGGLLPMATNEPSLFEQNLYQQRMLQYHVNPHTGPEVGVAELSRYSAHRRNEVCRNYLSGQCLYGEKCWFIHSDQKSHREPLLGPGGILNTSAVTMVPQPGMFPGGMGMDQYLSQYAQSKSQMGGANPTGQPPWQVPPAGQPPVFPFVQRGFMGGAQSQVVMRPYGYRNRFVPPPHVDQTAILAIPDPVLRFRLLSEGMIRDSTNSLVADISSLSVRADHFFVSFREHLHVYRILFGLDRAHDCHNLQSGHILNANVTCIHVSRISSAMVIAGTEGGGVYTLDTKKTVGMPNPLSVVREPQADTGYITALVHFTTVAAAQVVVAGDSNGHITWYIAQPPMKTFTILATQEAHRPHAVVCLQILGGCLISGGSDGLVRLWNMRTQEPALADSFQALTDSLLNIHVLDSSCFVSVGINHDLTPSVSSPPTIGNERPEITGNVLHDVPSPEITHRSNPKGEEDISTGMANLSVGPTTPTIGVTTPTLGVTPPVISTTPSNYNISLWEYGKPIKTLKSLNNVPSITCSAYYQHPLLGNRFLALGLVGRTIKIYNLPNFSIASEIHFQDISDSDCRHIALNLSRERENTHNFNYKNPFRDLILTTVWSDGRVMICQIDPRKNG